MALYEYTIGSTGDFSTWREFLESSDPGGGTGDWLITFLSGEIHDAERYQTSWGQGTWIDACNQLTVTSQGFTGIPYGETGGNATKFRFNYADNGMQFGGGLSGITGGFQFKEIEFECVNTNGGDVGFFKVRYSTVPTSTQISIDRCMFHSWSCGTDTSAIGLVMRSAGTGLLFRNCVFYSNTISGTADASAILRYSETSGNSASNYPLKVYGCTFVNNSLGGRNCDVIQSISSTHIKIKNNVVGEANDDLTPAFDPEVRASSETEGNVTWDGSGSSSDTLRVKINGTIHLTLASMSNSNYDGNYEVCPVYGTISDSDTNFTDNSSYRVFRKTVVANTTWYCVAYNTTTTQWEVFETDTNPDTFTNGATTGEKGSPSPEGFVATSETKNNINVPDSTDANVSYTTTTGSDVYTNIANGDFTHKATSPAIDVAVVLSTNVADEETKDLFDEQRDTAAANWDAGATAYNIVDDSSSSSSSNSSSSSSSSSSTSSSSSSSSQSSLIDTSSSSSSSLSSSSSSTSSSSSISTSSTSSSSSSSASSSSSSSSLSTSTSSSSSSSTTSTSSSSSSSVSTSSTSSSVILVIEMGGEAVFASDMDIAFRIEQRAKIIQIGGSFSASLG